jgi:hypothetical protein
MDLINEAANIDLNDQSYALSATSWSAFKRLLQRRWWGRLWVIQEVLLSKRAILNCGFKSAAFENLGLLKDLQTSYLLNPDPRFEPMKSGFSGPFDTILSGWNGLREQIANGISSIDSMCRLTSESQCALEADKVYGILSMCHARYREFKVDYSCCTRCLNLNFAKHNFRLAELHGPLMFFFQAYQVNKDPTLPSWCPDYTKEDPGVYFVIPAAGGRTKFTAGADNLAWMALGLPEFPDLTWHIKRVPNFAAVLENINKNRQSTMAQLTALFYKIHPFLSESMSTPPDPESFLKEDFAAQLEMLRQNERDAMAQMETVFRQAHPSIKTRNTVGLVIEEEGVRDILVLPGLTVDTVSEVYDAPQVPFYTGPDLAKDTQVKTERRDKTRSAIRNWRHAIHKIPSPYGTPEGCEEAFWRTLIADRDLNWHGPPTTESFAGRFESFLNDDFEANINYIRPYSHAVINRLVRRSFLVTEKGYLGLGRTGMRKGDLICIIRGGNVPFILRNRSDGFLEFVCDAYLHGVMDGSFVRDARPEDLKEFKIR